MTDLVSKYGIDRIMARIERDYGVGVIGRSKCKNLLPLIKDPVDQDSYLSFLHDIEYADQQYIRSPEFRQRITAAMREDYSITFLAQQVGLEREQITKFLRTHPDYEQYRNKMRLLRKQIVAEKDGVLVCYLNERKAMLSLQISREALQYALTERHRPKRLVSGHRVKRRLWYDEDGGFR